MSDTTVTTELGVIISNKTARQVIYAVYVLALLALGGLHIWYSSASDPDPQWLVQATAVLTYLGIPVGALGVANATNQKIVTAAATPADPALITNLPNGSTITIPGAVPAPDVAVIVAAPDPIDTGIPAVSSDASSGVPPVVEQPAQP